MKKLLSLIAMLVLVTSGAFAQSTTSGDLQGVVTDATGAVIPNATVTVKNSATGETKTASSGAAGSFRVALLSPGDYVVSATASGFSTTSSKITISAGTVSTDNLKLGLGQSSTVVDVTSAASIVNTENADLITTLTSEEVQALPNPGNDLTFVAQTAPGSVMNTGTAAGGYGNFSSFGISGLSNMFTLDGGYENDPFLNLNNTGASNLTLGNNEVDTVTIVAPAFSSQFGGLGGAQVNEITASGGNRVHGNASYYWDGRATNANDWFNKQSEVFNGQQNIPTFVNANQWGASIGGPIVHDKLFFFVNTEGIRAVTPAQGQVAVPNTAYQNCSLGGAGYQMGGANTVIPYDHYILKDNFGIDTGGQDVALNDPRILGPGGYTNCAALNNSADIGAAAAYYNSNYNTGAPVPTNNSAQVGFLGTGGLQFGAAATNQQTFLQTMYGVYNNSPFRPSTGVIQSPNDPTALTYLAHSASVLTEWLLTARLDYHIGNKDNFYIHYKQDHGIQPTYTDLIDPRFTDASVQPAWEGQINESHTFTPNLVNQLVLTGNYYSAPFENTNNYLPVAPYTLEFVTGSFTTYGGINYDFPQGRNVAGYQVIDDVSYTKGRNTLRFGYNLRRDNITDIQGVETVSPVALGTVEDLSIGTIDYEFVQRYPQRPTQPVSVYNMGSYIEDVYKVTPKLTLTAGLRLERNSNPTCHTNCFQVLSAAPSALTTGTASRSVPYNAASPGGFIVSGRHRAFTGFQKVGIMPRIGINYQLDSKTTVRGGFGMFTDTPPGLIADDLLSNAPDNFHALAYGLFTGTNNAAYPVTPGTTTTGPFGGTYQYGGTVTGASNTAFQNGFKTGQNYTQIAAAVAATGGVYSAPSFTTPAAMVKYPTYEEFSFAVERRIDSKTTVSATYVGNHGYHEPVADGSRNLSYSAPTATSFSNVPSSRPVTPFNTLTYVYSGASSNFNGVVVTAARHAKSLTVQLNYEFAKALDEISNGGLEPFAPDAGDSAALLVPGNLHANYGPADYNVKHNTTGLFVYSLPSIFKQGWKKSVVGGFEVSGDVFHQSGLPYSVTQSTSSKGASALAGTFSSGGVLLVAKQTTNNFDHHCGGGTHATLPDGSNPKPCGFISAFTTPTTFGQQSRNSLVGPSYTNVNLGLFKTFGFSAHYLENAKIKLGAQAFNLFNHPNFQNPNHGRSSDNTDFGGISSTVGAPTSILGSVGGADASARLIQLHGTIVF